MECQIQSYNTKPNNPPFPTERTEIRHEEDAIIELYNASMSGCTTTLSRLIHKEQNILNKISLTSMSETPLHISTLVGQLDFSRALLLLSSWTPINVAPFTWLLLRATLRLSKYYYVQTTMHA